MILVCGEALIDLFIGAEAPTGLPAEAVAGGSPFNVAIGLARLGRPAAFLSSLSEDAFGSFLADRLARAGVSSAYLHRCPNRTTLSVVATSPSGEPQYSFYAENSADRALNPDALPASLPADVNAIAAGSYALGVEPIAGAIEILIRREGGTRVVSLDPNVRPRVVGNLPAFRERFERLLTHATIIKASVEDIELLYAADDFTGVARDWLGRGPKLVIVTRGSEGPVALHGTSVFERKAPRVEVVDTVGAGDTFHAALLAWFDAHAMLTRPGIAGLTGEQLEAAMEFAAAAAAIVCTRRGANPPSWEEVLRFVQKGA